MPSPVRTPQTLASKVVFMSGILKALGVIILLSLTIRACGGKRFQKWEAEQNNKAEETDRIGKSRQSDDGNPSDLAFSVLRQCSIGSTPEFVESLMREKGLERTDTQNKTQDGKPRLIHFYGPDDAVFFFGRNSASSAWGLILVRIDKQGYFPPMTSGGPPIRME